MGDVNRHFPNLLECTQNNSLKSRLAMKTAYLQWITLPVSISSYCFVCTQANSGSVYCDRVLKYPPDAHTRKLQFLSSLYQFDRLINEPTRVTGTSATGIDLIFTNRVEKILNSGIVHVGISDHSLIFAVRKFRVDKSQKKYKIFS